MPADVQTEGMKVIRYMDFYSWTKDPDEIVLVRRSDVTDPKPSDCLRVKVEIHIPKRHFQPPEVDGVAKAAIVDCEEHKGFAGGEETVDSPEPLKAQGT